MNRLWNTKSIVGTLLALLGTAAWYWKTPTVPVRPTLLQAATVDAFMDHSFSQRFNETGALQETLSCTHWVHHRHRQETEMTDPYFIRRQGPAAEWRLHAERGLGSHANLGKLPERIVLSKAVEALRIEQKALAWQLFTDELTLYPQKEQCETTHLVLVQTQGNTISAQGMQASLKGSHVEFKNHVQSFYIMAPAP